MDDEPAFLMSMPLQFSWYFMGWDSDSDIERHLTISLIKRSVTPKGQKTPLIGVGIDYANSYIEPTIKITTLTRKNVITYKNEQIWLPESDGIYAMIDGTRFHLATLHAPFLPPSTVFLTFTKFPSELSNDQQESTFFRQKDTKW